MIEEDRQEAAKEVACRLAGDEQVCAECGDSVKHGSGKFANRVPILDDFQERIRQNRPHPEGAYICCECERKIEEEVRNAADRAYGRKL